MRKKEVAGIVWSYPMVSIGEKLLNVELWVVRSFIMSSETKRGNPLKIIVPIALVLVVALGSGYYFVSADSPPVVQWNMNSLKILVAPSGLGSGQASFTCSHKISPVTVTASSFNPSVVTFTVDPNTFSTCGSTPDNVVVGAKCGPGVTLAQCTAQAPAGSVTVCGPSPYTCLKKPLQVVVQPKQGPNPTFVSTS